MAYTPVRLAQFVAGIADTTVFNAPGGFITIIKNILVANTSGVGAVFTLSLVPAGGTSGVGNRIIPSSSIPANTVVPFDLTQVMVENDFLSAFAGTGGVVTVTISGMELDI